MQKNTPPDELYQFANERIEERKSALIGWKILIVDDKKAIHEVIQLALKDFIFADKILIFLHAYSGQEARQILNENSNIAIILLDVTMEQEDAGLQIVKFTREELKNFSTRIILCTGQLDYALETKIVIDYDVNEYIANTQLSSNRLFTAILANLRAYRNIQRLSEQQRQLEKINEAASRFIPAGFLQLLNKQSIIELALDDHIEQEMTILFLDIRSFTTISEFLLPLETIKFINNFVSYLEPVIVANKGFVDKYIGDGLMAIFATKADDAVNAAIAMLKSLGDYNYTRLTKHQIPIKIGVGINTGKTCVGVVGFEDRMDCTVISTAVNVASRIEDLTKKLGTHLLISSDTFLSLENSKQFHFRFIGKMTVKGKHEPVGIYEIFDMDPESILQFKEQTKEEFEAAISLYMTREFEAANKIFSKIVAHNSHDAPAKYFLAKTEELLRYSHK